MYSRNCNHWEIKGIKHVFLFSQSQIVSMDDISRNCSWGIHFFMPGVLMGVAYSIAITCHTLPPSMYSLTLLYVVAVTHPPSSVAANHEPTGIFHGLFFHQNAYKKASKPWYCKRHPQ